MDNYCIHLKEKGKAFTYSMGDGICGVCSIGNVARVHSCCEGNTYDVPIQSCYNKDVEADRIERRGW